MNESINYAEYAVAQKAEGKNLLLRILLITGYVLFAAAYFLFFTTYLKIVMLISLLPLFIWMLVFFTWRFAAVEHEYQISSGTITFSDATAAAKRNSSAKSRICWPLRPWIALTKATTPGQL